VQAAAAPRPQRHRIPIKGNLVRHLDLVGKIVLDLRLRDLPGQQDAPARRCPCEFAHRDIGRARQRRGLVQRGPAAIGQYKTSIATITRDAIGVGKREHHAGGKLRPALRDGSG
jgi:hypothetical protein